MDEILKLKNLTKMYGKQTVVNEINMTIGRGEIYGFLGQNGAGKTTAIRLMLGLIRPTSGEIEMFGKKITKDSLPAFRRVGAIIETPGAYKNLTAYENLDIHRRLMGLSDKSCIKEALQLMGLEKVSRRKAGTFSLGMKQRLGLARALLHRPELLILDEPTNGLDPQGIKEIRTLLLDLAETRKITILISSHILSEIEQLATKIGIIHAGRLLEELGMNALRRKTRRFLELTVSDSRQAAVLLRGTLQIKEISISESGKLRIYEGMEEAMKINRFLIEHGVDVGELVLNKGNLEDHFLQLTGGSALA